MNDNSQTWEEEDDSTTQRGGYPVDPARLWLSVRRDWRWIPIAAAVGLVLSAAYAKLKMQVTFQSETSIIYEPTANNNTRELSTLAGILTLPGTLAKVRARLKLEPPVKVIEKQIEVWFDRRGNLVTIIAQSNSGKGAAELANTLVDVFLEQQGELGKARATESASLLVGDMAAAQLALTAVRTRYDEFRRAHGIVDFEVEFAQAMAAVKALTDEYQNADTAKMMLKARAGSLSKLSRSQPKMIVQSATRSSPNAALLTELRAELASSAARLSPDHPQIRRLKSRITALEQSAAAPENVVSDVVSSSNPEFESLRSSLSTAQTDQAAAEEQHAALATAVKEAKQHLATLSGIEAEARGLLKEVTVAETRVEELRGQLALVREAERATAPEFRVLSRAPVPPYPESSKRRLVVVGATLGSALLALLVLIARTVRDGRVYTAREAAFWSKLPVVASSTWPRDERVFHRFVDELNDHATRTQGTTLVVSATPRGAGRATRLADWLGPTPRAHARDEKSVIGTEPSAQPSDSDAIAVTGGHNASALARRDDTPMSFHAWRGDLNGPDLRRACRLADRVLILVGSGDEPVTRLVKLRTLLGRETGMALIVHGLAESFADLPDRVGDADKFWRAG